MQATYIKSMQNTTELAYFTLYISNHTSDQHIRFTNHSKSSNSIQTPDGSQKLSLHGNFKHPLAHKTEKKKIYWPGSNPQSHMMKHANQ